MEKVNFAEKLGLFDDRWAPKIVAQMNDVHFKLAKVEGSFVWHEHGDTDEVFIVVDGTLCIEFEDQTALNPLAEDILSETVKMRDCFYHWARKEPFQ